MLPFCPNDFDDNNITKIAARAEESRQLARVHTLRAQDKDRRRYDSKHQMVSYAPGDLVWIYTPVLDESRSFFRVHTGYFSNIPKCIKAEFIASWACSQSSVVSSSKRSGFSRNLYVCESVIPVARNIKVVEWYQKRVFPALTSIQRSSSLWKHAAVEHYSVSQIVLCSS
ncbi:transposon Ty3-I Gag-Pol polyprotein [Trichonephila clavipes]|nr:transposon Ty3-I Gag-Pol polyprotein [Trichonephila clavipes]